ncbi:MAG: hypothetical protein SFU98_15315 [Leptospiraceae bacterium]|nr:hypothetical protein [Leptospiraceae bacterium]
MTKAKIKNLGYPFKQLSKLVLIVIFSVNSSEIFGETVILRSGKKIDGKVLGHDSESITILVDGESTTIPKTKVYKVIFSNNNSELRKFLSEKKGEKVNNKFNKEEPAEIDDNVGDKKELTQKLFKLEKTIDKLEKKMMKLKEKISKLKAKIKEKEDGTPKKTKPE